jgi:quercetin dioxygenase-like cupin family protein
MNRILDAGRRAAAIFLVVAAMADGLAIAQQPGFVVTPLLRTDLSGDPGRVVVIAQGEFSPGATTGRHSHPGEEYATVIEGALEVAATGQPPRRYVAGVDKGRALIEPAD